MGMNYETCGLALEDFLILREERDELKKQVEEFQTALGVEDIDEVFERLKEAEKERDAQEKKATYWKSRAIQQENELEKLQRENVYLKEDRAVLKKDRTLLIDKIHNLEDNEEMDQLDIFAARVGKAVLEMWASDLEKEVAE